MKTNLLSRISTFALAGLVVALTFGCSKSEAPQNQPPQKSTVVSAEKTSFNEVTSQLDPGGNFYMYLGTAQWLENLSSKTEQWRDVFTSMPGITDDQHEKINQAFNILGHVIQDSGIQDLSGVGASSIEIEPGLYRDKAVLHHYPDKGDGFLWQLAGKSPHPLDGLDLLPNDTALALFMDADVPLLWTVAQREAANSGIPGAQDRLQKFPAEFENKTGIKWDQFLHSLGGEFGLILTLDDSNNVIIPYPPSNPMQVPAPGLMLVVKVNDDTIFNRIDEALKEKPGTIAVDKADLKMRTMPLPLPFLPIQLRPSAASSAGYLFIASSDDLIEKALAVKDGREPGLKSTDEFKRLSQNIPQEGNQFCYASSLFGKTIAEIQKQAMSGAHGQPAQAQWMQSVFQNHVAYAFSVGMNTPQGCVTVGNSSQSYATAALLPAAIMSGTLAAIAVPNFVKARETSQRNACINNLRQIEAAKKEWALENNKTNGDLPTKEDLMPYLSRWPVCPSGGAYSINPVGDLPTCSISDHKLP
ncbi:MAG TPA: hypothetical protein VGJ73_15820 [Verrucomicrobiae bacterium]|jgi:hypothetical protein